MKFIDTGLEGCTLIEIEPIGDNRGFFARTFCSEEFAKRGLNPVTAQCSISFSATRGTTRGLHFQHGTGLEDKLVRCVQGSIFDVMVDLRDGSPTFGRWFGQILSAENNLQLYSSKGFAHGFQTLTDDCVVSYQIAQPYDAALSAGVLWNDPDIGIEWPLEPTEQSSRDLVFPRLREMKSGVLP
ncbi:dTDP-4-dehydrorhamnose 3,5-epimerase [Rhizobium deserti]|uniref:dTDP-4-dehydrorhamnose 3,5-epimerase n=1 Tax=Rhizobium deserti TaxID=2547961 RepID=A0A4R5UMM7_9HYPH|nr:dTDP-4-dehydrorhamnose 3,5-epimerase [Rhizobium deserti]TDK39142.1 dTDP-4-dehydrorhamnose 3,5-epimerase [Rhizobium deserti]